MWRHNACSSFWGIREKLPVWSETLPVTKKEGMGEGSGRLKTQHLPFVYEQNEICLACPYSILGLMLIFPFHILSFSVTGPTGKPLSCPQKWTARIVTSWDSHLAGGLSNKKARAYYFQTSLDFRSQLYQVQTNSQESVAEGCIDGGGWIWLQSRVDPLKKNKNCAKLF